MTPLEKLEIMILEAKEHLKKLTAMRRKVVKVQEILDEVALLEA
jgi:hypothetical protein